MARKSKKSKKRVPWTAEDEERLILNIQKSVTNLKRAFKQTAMEIGRTELACANHWYANTSRNKNHVLFMTISGKHVAFNRKNGKGEKSSLPIYKKILALFGVTC